MPVMTMSSNFNVAKVISKYDANCKLEFMFGYTWLSFLKKMVRIIKDKINEKAAHLMILHFVYNHIEFMEAYKVQ